MHTAKEINGFVVFKTSSFILCLPQHLLLVLQKAEETEKKSDWKVHEKRSQQQNFVATDFRGAGSSTGRSLSSDGNSDWQNDQVQQILTAPDKKLFKGGKTSVCLAGVEISGLSTAQHLP